MAYAAGGGMEMCPLFCEGVKKREAVFLISRFTVITCIHRNYKSYRTFRASTGLALDNNVLVHNRK